MSGRKSQELEGITLLGNQKTKYPDDYAPEVLETFENKHPENDFLSNFHCLKYILGFFACLGVLEADILS